MMDELALEKERDLSALKGKFEAIKVEKEALEKSLTSGQSELAERLASLQAEKTELAELEKSLRSKLEKVSSEASEKESAFESATKSATEVLKAAKDYFIVHYITIISVKTRAGG